MNTTTKIKYGLRNIETGEILGYDVHDNGDCENCNDTTVTLSSIGDKQWLIDNLESVYFTRYRGDSEPWYNSNMNRPVSDRIDIKMYEIVKVEIIKTISSVDITEMNILAYNTLMVRDCLDASPRLVKDRFGLDIQTCKNLRIHVLSDDERLFLLYSSKIGATLISEFMRFELLAVSRVNNHINLLLRSIDLSRSEYY